jgi:hypothetical protein
MLILLLFTQCKKDESNKNSNAFSSVSNPNAKMLYAPTVSPDNSDIIAKIESFQNKIIKLRNNNGLSVRSGDNMEVNDFAWNTEALLNFKYGEPNKSFKSVTSKADSIDVPLNSEGKVSVNDLANAVESIRSKVGQQWATVSSGTKNIIAIDLAVVESNTQSFASSAKIRIGIGIGIGPAPTDSGPFNESDSYYYTTAAKRLEQETNLRFPTYAKYSGFFVSNQWTPFNAFEYGNNKEPDNNRDFKLFALSSSYPNYSSAKLNINGSDMNYYFDNLDKILRNVKYNNGNLDFNYIFIEGNSLLCIGCEAQFHSGYHYFGNYVLADCQRVCNPEPGIGGACFYTPCGY